MPLNATFQSGETLNASFASDSDLTASIESTVYVPSIDDYAGLYEVTPSGETQTLLTEGLRMAHHVIINPVPSNYGRIAWNGSTITVL